ncbi:PrgI family protein [Candidatus Microgenomates bacterium]|nr:PrgI family protein [Candidatus Microgenomates bacterium]
MRFKVPRFLERETKIVGFLTFKQLALIGGTGLILLALYYALPKPIFFFVAIVALSMVFGLLFVRIEGISLGELIVQFFKYSFGSKKYLWQREKLPTPIKLLKEEEEKKKEETLLKISPKSKLKELSNKIEIGF